MILGIDGGNYAVKTSFEGHAGDNAIIIPTVTAPYRDYNTGAENDKRDLIDSLDVEITMNVDLPDASQKKYGRHLVGKAARDTEGENADSRRIGKTKIGDETLIISMLTSLAYAVCINQNKFDGTVSDDIQMVTGLPYAEYKNDKDQYAKQFLGTHTVKFMGGAEVELHIKQVDVSFEGADALNLSFYDSEGNRKYTDEEVLDRCFVGINVGEGTTELIVRKFEEVNGKIVAKYVKKLCTGLPIGTANAKQQLISHVLDHHNTKIDRYTIEKVVRRTVRRGQIDLNETEEVNGRTVKKTLNIIPQYDSYLKTTAKNLAGDITNKLIEANEHTKVMAVNIFGGAPKVLDNKFGNYMVDELKSALKTSVTVARNTSTADSDSYFQKALMLYDKEM